MKMFHPVTTRHRIYVQNVTIFWTLENVRSENNSISVDGVEKQFSQGYYNFDALKKLLEEEGIVIEKRADQKIELTATKDIDLKNFGQLLGFEKDKNLVKTTKHVSSQKLNLTNGLKKIEIYSNIVDGKKNLHWHEDKCYFSEILLDVPIDTTQSLNGVLTKYDYTGYSVPSVPDLRKHEIVFNVFSGGDINDYSIDIVLVL